MLNIKKLFGCCLRELYSLIEFIIFYFPRYHKFIKHQEKQWVDWKSKNSNSIILFEMVNWSLSIIAFSYLANILSRKHNATVNAYVLKKNKLFYFVERLIYKSMNVDLFIVQLKKNELKQLDELFYKIYSKLKSKKDVFNLKIDNVWIGDLIYDSHLRDNLVPTVNIEDEKFKTKLWEGLYQYYFWLNYFNNKKVKAINLTHTDYILAIPLRIALSKGIHSFQINEAGLYSLNNKRKWAYTEFYDYPRFFDRLPKQERVNGIALAKKRIEQRFDGKVGVDMSYSSKSAYGAIGTDPILKKSNKIKILVASHSFFDAPNGYGINLFPDFYEWLSFLGKLSKKTKYDWYIKTHPDEIPGNDEIVEEIISNFYNWTIIPKNTSHHQIIKEGINFALTVYGTIGFEYACLGIPTINASLSNPHIAYKFNVHPKNIVEYEEILMNLEKLQLEINKDEVYEYYYMKNIKNDMENWLINDYKNYIKKIGGYNNQFNSVTYKYFIKHFDEKKHSKRLRLLENFIESGDYVMTKNHY